MTLSVDIAVGRAPRVLDLAAHGDLPAVHTAKERVSYSDLAGRVASAAERLGSTRRLVLVEAANTLPALITYLAALTHGHAVLLTEPGRSSRQLVDSWDPDVVVSDDELRERRRGTTHDLHPELSLLLSTSGSTGSPRLVRLSEENLRGNATSIADYLGLTSLDRAITSLPMHYCYGLSVVHSHLLVGAEVLLSDLSVLDKCFWERARQEGATSFAGVPYTFDLLEQSGWDPASVPTLRRVTQAGGRLAPDRVREWAARGRAAGWDLTVMYGQTEATARMAWLPPHLADSYPESIGRAIPGGSLRIDPLVGAEQSGAGELVYSGPNVMMGYAEEASDLARGAELAELRTGDLAREIDGGLFEVLGRLGRQVKLAGLRIDLDHLEQQLADRGEVRLVVADERLHAFHRTARDGGCLRTSLAIMTGLPASRVLATRLDSMPLTSSGKPDYGALTEHARSDPPTGEGPGGDSSEAVRRDYALVLGRTDISGTDSFATLGGDSLSYVELATRLGQRLGELPDDWHVRRIDELTTTTPRRRGVAVDISVVLRAAAIVAIVGTHANLFTVVGGAHLLLAVAGFNFARFQLCHDTRVGRLRHGLASLVQILVPATVWIAAVGLVTDQYEPETALFLNGLLGSDNWTVQWQFWFLEALVWLTLLALVLISVPAFDRAERRWPYRTALSLVLVALTLRFAWAGIESGPTQRYTTAIVAVWFLLGWAATRADTPARRWTVVGLSAVSTFGFFGDPVREVIVVAGVAALVLLGTVRIPRVLVPTLSILASASLFIYLTHWQVYPHLEDTFPLGATLGSLAVGIGTWWLCRPLLRQLGGRIRPSVSAAAR